MSRLDARQSPVACSPGSEPPESAVLPAGVQVWTRGREPWWGMAPRTTERVVPRYAQPGGSACRSPADGATGVARRCVRALASAQRDELASIVPEPLTVDTMDGVAWLTLTPFSTTCRLVGAVPVPGPRSFPETNLRTYVKAPDGTDGLFFLSLDVTNRATRCWVACCGCHTG